MVEAHVVAHVCSLAVAISSVLFLSAESRWPSTAAALPWASGRSAVNVLLEKVVEHYRGCKFNAVFRVFCHNHVDVLYNSDWIFILCTFYCVCLFYMPLLEYLCCSKTPYQNRKIFTISLTFFLITFFLSSTFYTFLLLYHDFNPDF